MSNLQSFPQTRNSFTGVFGTGKVQFFGENGTFIVPAGITSVRVRVWGNGGEGTRSAAGGGGGGGGFAMKTITGLTAGTSITVTVGQYYDSGATCSFGSYVSATGGGNTNSATGAVGGTGVGGDINNTGGTGATQNNNSYNGGSGGCASYFGGGGDGYNGNTPLEKQIILGAPGSGRVSNTNRRPAGSRMYSDMRKSVTYDNSDLDFIGCGFSYSNNSNVVDVSPYNGAGAGGDIMAASPGGGYTRSNGSITYGHGRGLVIVEY
jgi:hypothetical protein